MCDFFEDFDDDFDEGESMDEDSFEDNLEEDLDMDETFDGDPVQEDGSEQDELQDDGFSTKEAFILGGAMGWSYKEGYREQKRRKRKKLSDDSD